MVNLFPQPFATKASFVSPPQPVQQQQIPPPPEANLPRVVNYVADASGCGHWRIFWPEQYMNAEGMLVSSTLSCMVVQPEWYSAVKTIKLQRQATSAQKQFVEFLIREIKPRFGTKIIYEVDDVVFREDIPDYNLFKFAFDNDEIRQNCIDIINMVDEVTVTCDYMRDLYRTRTGKQEITVIPNFPPNFWIGHYFNKDKVIRDYEMFYRKPRVLYAGSGAHYDVKNANGGKDDFSHVIQIIRNTVDKFQWVFMGAFPPPLTDLIQSGKIEFHPWQSLYSYPKKISELRVNAVIAPLEDNSFNRSKSDIKFIEACCFGIPAIVQDMCTYKDAIHKFTTAEEMIDKLNSVLRNRQQYKKSIPLLREIAEQRFLERPENIGCHVEALLTPYKSPERKYLNKWN